MFATPYHKSCLSDGGVEVVGRSVVHYVGGKIEEIEVDATGAGSVYAARGSFMNLKRLPHTDTSHKSHTKEKETKEGADIGPGTGPVSEAETENNDNDNDNVYRVKEEEERGRHFLSMFNKRNINNYSPPLSLAEAGAFSSSISVKNVKNSKNVRNSSNYDMNSTYLTDHYLPEYPHAYAHTHIHDSVSISEDEDEDRGRTRSRNRNRDGGRDTAEVRLVCYNILAEPYATSDTAVTRLFPYCVKKHLQTEYRIQLVLRELRAYDADVLLLQEVDRRAYVCHIEPSLAGRYCTHLDKDVDLDADDVLAAAAAVGGNNNNNNDRVATAAVREERERKTFTEVDVDVEVNEGVDVECPPTMEMEMEKEKEGERGGTLPVPGYGYGYGYDGHFTTKEGSVPEGCATFVRKSTFEVAMRVDVNLGEALLGLIEVSVLCYFLLCLC